MKLIDILLIVFLGRLGKDGDIASYLGSPCVVHRQGYLDRYYNYYGINTWEMRKSTFSILVERAAKVAALQDATLMLLVEKCGKTEDRLISSQLKELRSSGHPFNNG